MKKFFIITSVLFAIFLLFFLIYNFLFKNNPFEGRVPSMTVVDEDALSKEAEKEDTSDQKIAPLTESEAAAPFFDKRDGAIFFLSPDERSLKEIFLVTNAPKTVVEFPFVPKNIVWSPDMSRALVKKNDTEWVLFTRETKTVEVLKPGIESPAWTSLGDRIVYKYYDSNVGKRTINIASPNGTNWDVIGETEFQFLEMRAVPKSSLMALWNWGNAFEKTSLRTLSLVGNETREIFSSNFGADYVFSPDGTKILVSNVIEKGGSAISLALLNSGGGNYRNLFIPTLAGKTVWSKNSRMLYYALPGSLPPGSILPNDYYRKPILTTDTFWKADTETGEKSRVVDPSDIDRNYDAENLVLDTDETTLFFRNRHDRRLYRINL